MGNSRSTDLAVEAPYSMAYSPRWWARKLGVSRNWAYRQREPFPLVALDRDGYPTEETLRIVREWPIRSNYGIKHLLRFVEEAWRNRFVISRNSQKGRESYIKVATHGWSGNESLIGALRENRVFWALCWLRSERGGGHWFLRRPILEDEE